MSKMDKEIEQLRAMCENIGYGAVMFFAAAMWANRNDLTGNEGGIYIPVPYHDITPECRTHYIERIGRLKVLIG